MLAFPEPRVSLNRTTSKHVLGEISFRSSRVVLGFCIRTTVMKKNSEGTRTCPRESKGWARWQHTLPDGEQPSMHLWCCMKRTGPLNESALCSWEGCCEVVRATGVREVLLRSCPSVYLYRSSGRGASAASEAQNLSWSLPLVHSGLLSHSPGLCSVGDSSACLI